MTKVGIAAQEASNFMLEGPTGEVAYKQAEEIAGLIRHDNSAH